jgi:SPX domain protein involved in polyphosphate accumulation
VNFVKNKIKRFERKWIFRSNNSLALINALIRSNLFFRTQYPKRNVNSIYFDTYNFTSIRQNLDGVSDKKKIRIRWYGNKNIMINPVVEIKSKRGFETKKESSSIKQLDNIKLSDFEIIKKKLNKKLKIKKIINPILTTNYEREYFVSLNGKVRATVDYNLKSIFLNNSIHTDIVKNFKNICILEFKYATSLDRYVRENLKEITLRLSKNSKFVNSALEKPKFFS